MNKNYEEFKKECTKAMEVLGIYDRALEIRKDLLHQYL